jgi:hypothetical protein
MMQQTGNGLAGSSDFQKNSRVGRNGNGYNTTLNQAHNGPKDREPLNRCANPAPVPAGLRQGRFLRATKTLYGFIVNPGYLRVFLLSFRSKALSDLGAPCLRSNRVSR